MSNFLFSAKSRQGDSIFHISIKRLFISVIILSTLTIIALFIQDSFIRPFLGDVLVVVWLYYLMSSVLNLAPIKLSFIVVSISFAIEAFQYLSILKLLGLDHYSILRIILGSTFDWMDLFAYTIGGVLCLTFERSPTIKTIT
ncbi:membrane protein [Aliivibrio wodanis]|nr:membrane protein [Aliivibrio wodanis]